MSDYFDPQNKELLKDFFAEAQMQIELLEQNILVLESDTKNKDAIDEIFRAAHTLKGGSGTVGMEEIYQFTHLLEDLLDEMRKGTVNINEKVIDNLLSAIDIIKLMIEKRVNGEVFTENIDKTITALKSLIQETPVKKKIKKGVPPSKQKKAKTITTIRKDQAVLDEYEILELRETAGKEGNLYKISVEFNEDNVMNTVGGIQVYATLKDIGKIIKTIPEFELLYEDNFFPVITYFIATDADKNQIQRVCKIPDVTTDVKVIAITESRFKQKTKEKQEKKKKQKEEIKESPLTVGPTPKRIFGSVLRVDSKRIDTVLNIVSEIVINKSAFNQIGSQLNNITIELQNIQAQYRERMKDFFKQIPDFFNEIQKGKSIKIIKKEILTRFGDLFNIFSEFETLFKETLSHYRSATLNLGRITSELQEGVMQIRMVPISHIFSRFPRLVRDLSKNLKKDINLIIEGEETELDKSVIEDLLDPLIHCVRNSIDHGIEDQKERKRHDKDPTGNIFLKAVNEGNMIIIEVADDGKGIDVGLVRKKAIDKGLIHPNKSLSDIEAFNLIFEPGFSTAKSVTDVSGRGVGLDVVKKQIEKLNGSVSVWSEKYLGTRFTIKLPLTLAIIQGLLVKIGQETYAIPLTSVIETMRIKPEEIKLIDNYEVINVRDEVLSLIRLNRLFKIKSQDNEKYYFVVIVGSQDNRIGLLVDTMIGEEDLVIKPLKDRFTKSPGIAGATILGDGTVSLIIDVAQLLELSFKMEIEERKKREKIKK